MDKFGLLFSLFLSFMAGAIITMFLIRITANHATGFGIECADKVLNNPEVHIDTAYTICQQDTTVTYHFVKNR